MDLKEIDKFYGKLGERIRMARERNRASKLSQGELGKMIGLSRTSIVNIEKGRQHVQIHTLAQIAQLLKVNTLDLIPSFTSDPINLPTEITSKMTSEELPSVANILKLITEENGNGQNQEESRRVARKGKDK